MENKYILELIHCEEVELKYIKSDYKGLSQKWFLRGSQLRYKSFLELYIPKKEKFIETLKQMMEQQNEKN
jgi:hypothetical protein